VSTTVQEKLRESVSVKDFGAVGNGIANDTAAIEAGSTALAAAGGGVLYFPSGTYKYTRLTIRSGVVFQGASSQNTFLVCTDSTTLDASISIGSSIRKPDNGARVFRAGFKDIFISGGVAGSGSQEATFQNIIGINLCACERTLIENVAFGGFGQGAIVLARAEAGAEGLGFVSTTEDGNYNVINNISIGNCGAYNADTAAIWFKYKANSNKLYAIFAKGLNAYMVAITHGNDNALLGGTLESGIGVANLGLATGNLFTGVRIEGASGDGYLFGATSENNMVTAGYHTGVTGQDFNLTANPNNRIISGNLNYLRSKQFPPASSYSTLNNLAALQVTSINGDPDYPLYVKSAIFNDATKYPYQLFWSDVIPGAAGNILGRIGWRNSDTSASAAGVSASIDAVLEGSGGQTAVVISTGTGTTLSEKFRIRNDGGIIQTLPTAAATLTADSTMTMALTSNTNLRISVRGSDGVTRVANLALA